MLVHQNRMEVTAVHVLGLVFCFFCRAVYIHRNHSGKAFLSDYQRTKLPFLIHKVLLQLWACGDSEAKQNQVTSGLEPPWTTEKSLILFLELVLSLSAVAPNTKSADIPRAQPGEQAFPRPLERGMLRGCSQWRASAQPRDIKAAAVQQPQAGGTRPAHRDWRWHLSLKGCAGSCTAGPHVVWVLLRPFCLEVP